MPLTNTNTHIGIDTDTRHSPPPLSPHQNEIRTDKSWKKQRENKGAWRRWRTNRKRGSLDPAQKQTDDWRPCRSFLQQWSWPFLCVAVQLTQHTQQVHTHFPYIYIWQKKYWVHTHPYSQRRNYTWQMFWVDMHPHCDWGHRTDQTVHLLLHCYSLSNPFINQNFSEIVTVLLRCNTLSKSMGAFSPTQSWEGLTLSQSIRLCLGTSNLLYQPVLKKHIIIYRKKEKKNKTL